MTEQEMLLRQSMATLWPELVAPIQQRLDEMERRLAAMEHRTAGSTVLSQPAETIGMTGEVFTARFTP